ncbi:MAG: TonB-dependent receptor [Bacteroidales bacterium]|nr:TonB-dependent receptor [Bacteroidales bacterium]
MRQFFLLGLLTLLFPFALSAQNITVSGKVFDASTNEPLVGVTVVQTGTQNGTITDIDGNYNISVPSDASLTFSYIGYITNTVFVNGKSTLPVSLDPDNKTLEQVVVVGYGTMKKSDVSGSVASVDTKDMMKRAPANVNQGLQGAAAGVMVTQQDGSPDGRSQVRIRGVATINGNASPLYVVDGVQIGTDASFINPADIERMEVLKDASATAIYGSAGANGVIMITTKHGSKGSTRIDFTADLGVQTLQRKLDVLDVETYAKAFRTAKEADGKQIVNPIWTEAYDGQRKEIDWQDELTETSLRQQYNLSVAGGTDKTQSQFSIGWLDNQGIVVNTGYKRLTARANVKTKAADFLELGGDINFIHGESHGSNSATNNNGNLSSLRDMAFMCPTMDYVANGEHISPNVVNPDGSYGGVLHGQTPAGSDCITALLDNPYAMQKELNGKNYVNRMLASANLRINIYKGLTFNTIVAYNYSTTGSDNHSGHEERWNYDSKGNIFKMNRSESDLDYRVSFNQSQSNNISIENYFNYQWKNDAINLQAMIGQSASKGWGSWLNSSAKGFQGANIRDISQTTDNSTKATNANMNIETRTVSYYGRLVFGLFDKYIVTGTIRRDGSSNFGKGNRWGVFPSAALAWRISEEEFLKGNEVISNLKLRLGWGQTGNSGTVTNKGVSSITAAQKYSFYGEGSGDGTMQSGYFFTLADTDLKWETNEQTNIGLDLGLYNGQFNFVVDYFIRTSKDLLIERTLRASSGNTEVYTNMGEIQNKGLEIQANWIKNIGDWGFNVTLTGATLKNKITKLPQEITKENNAAPQAGTFLEDGSNVGAVGDPQGFFWNRHSMSREGDAVGSFWGYKVTGIIKDQAQLDALNSVKGGYLETGVAGIGDYTYEDVNGDGRITTEDQQILGNGFPKFNYGINIAVNWKNWDFSLYGYGVAGQKLYSYSAMRLSSIYYSDDQTVANLLKDSYNDIWSPSNPNGSLARLTMDDPARNMRGNSMWVKDADYFKISNIQIGYTFNKDLIAHLRMTNARVYFSIQNLACFSKYNKYGDPECGISNVLFTGLDTGRYPVPRTYQFGVSLSF